ncbi:enoyl-ACP reductase FabI [Aureispira anguillae]|uniref:Enoyl-[acyl-carrier-protein] reductase [NADH] n=1 Tax=Aureispira anguillae TaxID=2864201 RepID=A0A915YHL2_9BACT|nr:SDR family oxidoreductase [Aureispira anguillae]BDS13319.1 SDR family oxidoreductase [Aureispira anguillae]
MILKGKKGIIFGALNDMSIAWKVAELCVAEGAEIVLTNAPVAFRMKGDSNIKTLAEKLNCPAIPADATRIEDLEKLIDESMAHFGGKIDFVLHSIGMSINIRKDKPYTDLNHDFMLKSFDISSISFHKLMQSLWKKEAVNDWGSILALTYIGAQRIFPHYSEMAEAKSMLESFARSFGYHFGERNNIRVNTISQSPTMTTAGTGIEGFQEFLDYAENMSPIGNAPAQACAEYCISLFSDYTRYVTMQNLYHDGGFSNMGMNPAILNK